MMKYGESGSDDEAGSGSGSEDDEVSEPEEEEETAVLLNRPPKRARQESKTEQAGTTLVPKEEGPSLASSKSRFHSICNALGELQAEHDCRSDLLKEACLITACGPAELPDQIRKLMVDQAKVEDTKKLKEENARLKQRRRRSGCSHLNPVRWLRRPSSSTRRWGLDQSHPQLGLR
jgi:hypothetical protein